MTSAMREAEGAGLWVFTQNEGMCNKGPACAKARHCAGQQPVCWGWSRMAMVGREQGEAAGKVSWGQVAWQAM